MDILAQAVQLIGKGLKQSLIALEAGIGICTSLGGLWVHGRRRLMPLSCRETHESPAWPSPWPESSARRSRRALARRPRLETSLA